MWFYPWFTFHMQMGDKLKCLSKVLGRHESPEEVSTCFGMLVKVSGTTGGMEQFE